MTAPTDFHRKVVIAKVLHDRHPGRTLPDYAADAQAILDALNEPVELTTTFELTADLHEAPALSVEQQIRLTLVGYVLEAADGTSEAGDLEAFARDVADIVGPLAIYVATGAAPVPAELAPPLPADQDTTTSATPAQ